MPEIMFHKIVGMVLKHVYVAKNRKNKIWNTESEIILYNINLFRKHNKRYPMNMNFDGYVKF